MRLHRSLVAALPLVLLATTAIGLPNPATRVEHRSVENTSVLEPRVIGFGSFEEVPSATKQGSKSTPQPSSEVQPPQGPARGSSAGGGNKKKTRHRGSRGGPSRQRHLEKQQAKWDAKRAAWAAAEGASSEGGHSDASPDLPALGKSSPPSSPASPILESGTPPPVPKLASGVQGTATASGHHQPPHADTVVPQPSASPKSPTTLPSPTEHSASMAPSSEYPDAASRVRDSSRSASNPTPSIVGQNTPKKLGSKLNPNAEPFVPRGHSEQGSVLWYY